MAWRCRFMSASAVPKSTQKVVHRDVVAGLAGSMPDIPPDHDLRPRRRMVTCRGAARPRTSWSKSATRSQLRGSRPWPARSRHAGGPRKACGQKYKSARSGVRNRKYQSVASPDDHAPAHRRPGVWSSWEVTLRSKTLSTHADSEAKARKALLVGRDNRPLPRHLGGACELRARLMRCFDGSEQQRHHRWPCGHALQRGRWHLPSGLPGRGLGSSVLLASFL